MNPPRRSDDGARLSNGLAVAEVGRRVREARRLRGLTLQDLADAARVSRSMVSEIERGTKVATFLVLDRVAGALGTSIARLLDEHRDEPAVVLRSGEQRVVRDDGWTWRMLSPAVPDSATQVVRVVAPPASDGPAFPAHGEGSREWIAVESGRLRVTVGDRTYDLAAGDSITYVGGLDHRMSNPADRDCVYVLVVDPG